MIYIALLLLLIIIVSCRITNLMRHTKIEMFFTKIIMFVPNTYDSVFSISC